MRQRFRGRIAGTGTTSGVRVVVGHWHDTPLGAFSDAMVETAAGHRVLLAPHRAAADFIAATYTFDEVRIEPFSVVVASVVASAPSASVPAPSASSGERWLVRSPSLRLDLVVGARTALGRLLRLVPARLAAAPAFCALTDPVARLLLDGVRTRGSAAGARREWYGATDHHALTAADGSFDGVPLGGLAPVDPPPRFGFSSTPPRPSVTDVVTTVEL
ncbi:hypothetical protein GGQ22_14840 [Nocardioides sp. zg-579]|uniref:Uncharacterized protein n=1 Tax=Nocardioides marmotae TaxID=2663857 RepID=A0A6I3JE12_9ACTN|nr:hypothetical protein [Nocardioides marmotae]MCR6032702.1 hypothetical protein [Gordonia jinghuaiqii]MTB96351.1 hypothetical protein [Nocardioides marmotae]QKE03165.1 hypothetical protein HPC71_20455 [Nocardioides marmotae]